MKVIDLFSGCGGMSLGFQEAGYNILSAFDNWNKAIEIYKSNFKHPIINLDLEKSDIENILAFGMPDVIIGGPPCQDFSSAGKRDENGGRANLTIKFAEIVTKALPFAFVMENVPNIVKSQTLPIALEMLKEAGYGLTEIVLNAYYCGVPQDRKRYFLIGIKNEKNDFLRNDLISNLGKIPLTIREYFKDTLDTDFYYRHPRSYLRRGIFSIDEPSPTIRGVNRPIPKTYNIHSNDACEDISKVRALTLKERSQIQTFPEDFIFEGNKTDLEQIIGNAVPVNLAKYVATILLKYLKDKYFTKLK